MAYQQQNLALVVNRQPTAQPQPAQDQLEMEREATSQPIRQEIDLAELTERVYRLLQQDLAIASERRG